MSGKDVSYDPGHVSDLPCYVPTLCKVGILTVSSEDV